MTKQDLYYMNCDITSIIPINKPVLICHGVNCLGAYSAGVAGAIAREYPKAKKKYLRYVQEASHLHLNKTILPGSAQLVKVSDGIIIANCFTQISFGNKIGTEYASHHFIEQSLLSAIQMMRAQYAVDFDMYSTKIGCGLGGLFWDEDSEERQTSSSVAPTKYVFTKVAQITGVPITIVDNRI